jgi:CheY-like chemotaxis protein
MTSDRGFADLTGAKILVVENDRDYLELLITLLGHCGAHVFTARTVVEAKNAAKTAPPDVILCDLRLDGDFAVDFLTWLRAQPAPLGGVPAVAMTGFYEDFPRAKAADVAFKTGQPGTAVLDALGAPSRRRRGRRRRAVRLGGRSEFDRPAARWVV